LNPIFFGAFIYIFRDIIRIDQFLNFFFKTNLDKIDCFSPYWIAFLPYDDVETCIEKFKESVLLLINYGANPFIISEINKNLCGIDQLLKKIMALPNNNDCNYFKKEIVSFLLTLGAEIK
jgi:hypothetical protein